MGRNDECFPVTQTRPAEFEWQDLERSERVVGWRQIDTGHKSGSPSIRADWNSQWMDFSRHFYVWGSRVGSLVGLFKGMLAESTQFDGTPKEPDSLSRWTYKYLMSTYIEHCVWLTMVLGPWLDFVKCTWLSKFKIIRGNISNLLVPCLSYSLNEFQCVVYPLTLDSKFGVGHVKWTYEMVGGQI